MKKVVLFFCFFMLGWIFSSFSQTITLLDSESKQPIAFAMIEIQNVDNKQKQQLQSNEKGELVFELVDSMHYKIDIIATGFISYSNTLKGVELKKLSIIRLNTKTIGLTEVIVTGQYEPILAEKSVQKVKLIDSKKIEQMGAVTLKDVLSNELNIRLSQDNVLGSSMNMQGISGENVKILIDGVPIIGRLNGNVDLSQINLNTIERIEIIEGPLSVQYGTNALAGTINLITKKNKKNIFGISLSPYYESVGNYNISFDADIKVKKSNFNFTAGRNFFDGWSAGDKTFKYEKEHIADTSRFEDWKMKEQYFAGFKYNYSFKKLELGYNFSYFDEKITNRGMPRAPYLETAFDDIYNTLRIDNAISLTGKIAKNWNVNNTNSFNYYERIKNTFFKDLTTLEQVLTANPSDQDTSQFTLLMSRTSFSRTKDSTIINYEFGYDVNYESALGKRIEGATQYLGDFAAFVTTECKPIKSLILKPGLRYSYNTSYKSPIIPSFNVKYAINDNNTIRAHYARGFRAPSLKELYFYFVDINHNIVGNTNLVAEVSNNYSFSYFNKLILKEIIFKTDVSFFYNDIFNLITLAQTSGTEYTYVNIGRYKTLGASLSENFCIKNLKLTVGGSYIGRYNELSEIANVDDYSFSPEINVSANYFLKKAKVNFSLYYKYNGKLQGFAISENEVVETTMDDYHLLDATISKKIWKERLGITLGCKNILDIKNIGSTFSSGGAHSSSNSSVPFATGRNYFIKLTLKLWKESDN